MMTSAIRAGANDVSMIQAADIGVKISGMEGMQMVDLSHFPLIDSFHKRSNFLFWIANLKNIVQVLIQTLK